MDNWPADLSSCKPRIFGECASPRPQAPAWRSFDTSRVILAAISPVCGASILTAKSLLSFFEADCSLPLLKPSLQKRRGHAHRSPKRPASFHWGYQTAPALENAPNSSVVGPTGFIATLLFFRCCDLKTHIATPTLTTNTSARTIASVTTILPLRLPWPRSVACAVSSLRGRSSTYPIDRSSVPTFTLREANSSNMLSLSTSLPLSLSRKATAPAPTPSTVTSNCNALLRRRVPPLLSVMTALTVTADSDTPSVAATAARVPDTMVLTSSSEGGSAKAIDRRRYAELVLPLQWSFLQARASAGRLAGQSTGRPDGHVRARVSGSHDAPQLDQADTLHWQVEVSIHGSVVLGGLDVHIASNCPEQCTSRERKPSPHRLLHLPHCDVTHSQPE